MKNKIAVWCALLALLVALVPPSSAKADEVDVDKLCKEACEALLNDATLAPLLLERKYFVAYSYSAKCVQMVVADANSDAICVKHCYSGLYLCSTTTGSNNRSGTLYSYVDGVWKITTGGAVGIDFLDSQMPYVVASCFDVVYAKAGSIVMEKVPTVQGYLSGYTFVDWCIDAELNCYASSNESASVIPYSYNDYWHIVRKTSSGKWLLTTIGNSVWNTDYTDYTLMLSEDSGELKVLNLYSGEDVNGYILNMRQYVYDTDGWRLLSYNTADSRDTDDNTIYLGAGSGVDGARVLAYTSVDIYNESFEVVMPASTEYTEPTTPESPSEEITPTPTNAPSGGGVGGGTRPEVTPAVSAGQATVILDRTGIYEEPSTTSQLQHYLYSGALVYVVDELENGWYYVRYEVGGLSQVGYVYSENIDYSSENGYASDIVGGEVVEKVEEMLGMVKVVPVMISVLFSFLPPWCLAVVGVGFSLLIALVIYKCARG